MITVSPRARRYRDRSGDPLDGLVNLFDVGVVLAVAFLLAALGSPVIARRLTDSGRTAPTPGSITVSPGEVQRTVPSSVQPTIGDGTPIGRVYRTKDGRLIYVIPSSALPGATSTAPSGTPSPQPSPTR